MLSSHSRLLLCSGLIFFTGCAIPRHGGVFALHPVNEGGLVDRSLAYAGDYLRITNREDRLGLQGGSATHQHDISHTHTGTIGNADQTFPSRGTANTAASATHTHAFYTQDQSPTLSGDAANEFTHIKLGFLVRDQPANSVPEGVIIGYVGATVPKGWTSLDGTHGQPNLDGLLVRIAPQSEWGQLYQASPHTHSVAHTHEVVIRQSDPASGQNVQTYSPVPTGLFPALAAHGHLVTGLTLTSSSVGPVQPAIPELRMAFLISTRKGARLPSGAVIVMTNKSVPGGWDRIGEVLNQARVAPRSEGFFLAGQSKLGSPTIQDAPADHLHTMQHAHSGTVGVAVGIADTKATQGENNPIAPDNHTHILLFSSDGQTAPASHLPKYVQFFLIVKL